MIWNICRLIFTGCCQTVVCLHQGCASPTSSHSRSFVDASVQRSSSTQTTTTGRVDTLAVSRTCSGKFCQTQSRQETYRRAMNHRIVWYLKGAKLSAIQMVCYSDNNLYSGLLLSTIQITILIHNGQIVCYLKGISIVDNLSSIWIVGYIWIANTKMSAIWMFPLFKCLIFGSPLYTQP